MSKFRIRFTKGPEVRFVSHLDTMKMLERAIRRASLPIAFSEGFNPHPKIALGSALAVGVTSTAEYADLEFRQDLNAEELMNRLNQALPRGYQVSEAKELRGKTDALMAVLNRATYQITVQTKLPINQQELSQAIGRVLDKTSIVVTRDTKRGPKDTDIRPGIFQLEGQVGEQKSIELNILVETGSSGNIRPEEVVKALEFIGGLEFESGLLINRTGLYVYRESELLSPMDC